jgi:selenocysteine-specific elongation factor
VSTIRTVIVGTAGHIDHGKSALVRSLTGIDPDRLEEERARGMTIDLGFAPYAHDSGATVGMIDVPGHERFIRNMVAGSTSIDLAMLVVAADDGVMPQTREHLAILQLLGVGRGLVALSKIDLVDPDLRELAVEELEEFLAGTFLEGAPVVPVSAITGDGMDTLRTTLDGLIEQTTPHVAEGSFRLPVQRVFSAKGHGLVATGVPISGAVRAGDTLEVVRTGRALRVRAVQAYGEAREQGQAGHSTALNLAGGDTDDLTRGDVLATPGAFRVSRFVALAYEHVTGEVPLRMQHPVRLHAGTAEVMGRAVLLDGDQAEEGQGAAVQLRLDEAVCCVPGDRVILRDAASMRVLGGGTVLALTDGRLKRNKDRVLGELGARAAALGDVSGLAAAVVASAGPRGVSADALAVECGVTVPELEQALAPVTESGELLRAGPLYVTRDALLVIGDELVTGLKHAHRARPLLDWVDQAELLAGRPWPEAAVRAALVEDARIEIQSGGRVRRRGHKGRMSDELMAARDRLVNAVRDAGPCPPAVDEALTGVSGKDTAALVEHLRHSGELVAAGPHLFHRDAMDALKRILVAHADTRDGAIDIPVLRDELGTTRKYLIPLLESFDAEGLTVRHGDRRVLRRREG